MSETPLRVIADETGLQQALGYVNYLYEERCETHLTIEPKHRNRIERLHGGIHATLLDSALGFAASAALSKEEVQFVVTLSLTVNYLASSDETQVKAIGRVTRAGRSVVYAEGEVIDAAGTVLATATGVFKRVHQG